MLKGSNFLKTFSNKEDNYIYTCDGLSMFGGYKIY